MKIKSLGKALSFRVNFLALVLIAFSFSSSAQVYQIDPAYGRQIRRYMVDTTLIIPTVCGTPTLRSTITKKAAIAFDSCNHKFYFYDPKTLAWDTIAGGSGSIDYVTQGYGIKVDSAGRVYTVRADSTVMASQTRLNNQLAEKQNLVTLTTTGSSGASTFNQSTGALNIPNYAGGGGSVEYVVAGLGTQVDSLNRRYTVNLDTASTVVLSRQRAAATYEPVQSGTGFVKKAGTTTTYVPQVSLTSEVTGILPVANGGTGTATPNLVAGTNITSITGTWPNQTINAAASSGSKWTAGTFNPDNIHRASGQVGIGDTARSRLTVTYNNLGINSAATPLLSDSTGIMLINGGTAAAGAQQASPAITWVGQGWKTNATAASQRVTWRAFVLPVQGAATPTSQLKLGWSVNSAGYTDPFNFGTDGAFTASSLNVASFATVIGANVSTGSITTQTGTNLLVRNGIGTTRTEGTAIGNGTTSGTQYSPRLYFYGTAMNATSVSTTAKFAWDVLTLGGTTPITAKMVLGSSINLAAYTDLAAFTDIGQFGLGTVSPVASSKIEIVSTTQGFLPPRMTTTERDAITSPAEGLIIYNLTTRKLNVYTTVWEQVTSL